MNLSDFIRANSDQIAKEWEAFARTCSPAAASMNISQLRNHILPLRGRHGIAPDGLRAEGEGAGAPVNREATTQ